MKKAKHNHFRNLETVLNELRQRTDHGGVQLNQLALRCGVSTRQIYRYLNELQNMGYEIVKTSYPNASFTGGYILIDSEQEHNFELSLMNLLADCEKVKEDVQKIKLFVKELLIHHLMCKLNMMIPMHIPIYFYEYEDVIHVHNQRIVSSKQRDDQWEDIRIKVSAKVINSVTQVLGKEIKSRQRLRDGWFNVHLKTLRAREMSGLLTQWGSDVDVIEPGWLKHKILENSKAILYANRLKKVEKLDKGEPFSTDSKYLMSN